MSTPWITPTRRRRHKRDHLVTPSPSRDDFVLFDNDTNQQQPLFDTIEDTIIGITNTQQPVHPAPSTTNNNDDYPSFNMTTTILPDFLASLTERTPIHDSTPADVADARDLMGNVLKAVPLRNGNRETTT